MIAALTLALLGGPAWGCTSVEGIPVFKPDVDRESERMFFDDKAVAFAPGAIDARVLSVRRAKVGDYCGPQARIQVGVAWVDKTDARLQDVGIYFKVLRGSTARGEAAYNALNDLPRVVTVKDGVASVDLFLTDTDKADRGPVDLDVEVFAIDKLLRIGPSTRLHIRAD